MDALNSEDCKSCQECGVRPPRLEEPPCMRYIIRFFFFPVYTVDRLPPLSTTNHALRLTRAIAVLDDTTTRVLQTIVFRSLKTSKTSIEAIKCYLHTTSCRDFPVVRTVHACSLTLGLGTRLTIIEHEEVAYTIS